MNEDSTEAPVRSEFKLLPEGITESQVDLVNPIDWMANLNLFFDCIKCTSVKLQTCSSTLHTLHSTPDDMEQLGG
jgi:hypothetical protein